ncbi:AEC family transporter [Caproicibacter fermentans]|uniref:AEC family transporter n=1 Tax=Caproicibacter fermentans TaxID=2576756 RepID=A0A7G8TFF3_9FIRM|nr:AEC family transporter [Caproicibacter fermentans]QNK42344.1 AEC family transporter [Caproicibacter fermentans]
MLSLFLSVLLKVAVLFFMVAAGYFCGKLNLISDGGAKEMTAVLFWIVTPCLVVASLQSMIGKVSVGSIFLSGALSVICIAVSIGVSFLLYRKHPSERRRILRFAASYSNCGFMGLPLVNAVLGGQGVAYASMFIAAFNLFVWTHGVSCMKKEPGIDYKKAILNPGIIGLAIGLVLFVLSVRLPEVILSPMEYFSDLNTPLAMLVVGVYISEIPLKELFADTDLYHLSLIRLLVVPVLCFLILLPLHVDRTIFTTLLILSSAPSAANSVMFAAQFGGDTRLGSKAVALTTLFSALTMPLFPILVDCFY